MNQSKLFISKNTQLTDIQWGNCDINSYFYESKKNSVLLIKTETSEKKKEINGHHISASRVFEQIVLQNCSIETSFGK